MKLEIQHLLDKLEIIRLRQELASPTDRFNIFRILRPEADEVNLHSRFLYELLNPKGSHGMGNAFLTLFIEIVAKVVELPELNYNNVQVFRERANIDILIQDNQHAIVIENKICANDQHGQLKRYHEYVFHSYRKPTLFYLTLDGKEPSNESIGDLNEQVHLISYREQIDHWLTRCIKEAATRPALRETILQYQALIRQLTGNTMSDNEKQEILDLISQHDNAEKALLIARNWGHVRWHTEWDFWNGLLALVESAYEVSANGKFSNDALDKVVHGRRGRNPWYGLSFCVGRLYSIPVNVRIERNEGPMYYGVTCGNFDDTVRARMRMAIQSLTNQHTVKWAGLKSTKAGIDFESFTNSVTLQLVNPEKRKRIIAELWQEMQEFSSEATAYFGKEFGADFVLAVQPRSEE